MANKMTTCKQCGKEIEIKIGSVYFALDHAVCSKECRTKLIQAYMDETQRQLELPEAQYDKQNKLFEE